MRPSWRTLLGRMAAVLGLTVLLVVPTGASWAGADAGAGAPVGSPAPDLTLYWGDGCPRCEEERAWLAEAVETDPDLSVAQHEVWFDEAARDRFASAGEELGFEASAVPTTVVGERVWIGWTDAIADDVAAALERVAAGQEVPPGVYGTPGAGTCTDEDLTCTAQEESASVDLPFVGPVSLGEHSLVASTLIIGFVDGVNPCSLWVISVLLTIVLRTASRRRVIAVGSTFLLVTTAMYALYMAGIYSALTVVGYLGAVQVVVVLAAGLFGLVSVKDYFAFKRGVSFTIADSAKPGIYQRVRRAAGQRALVPALLATAALGVAVSLLETPCTAGFPVLWTGLLQANGVGAAEAVGLFVVYMVPFLLDEVAVFTVAVVTMRAAKMQERHGEVLKLVAGVTMLTLAGAMVVDPALMEDPVAALLLFLVAFGTAAVVHLVTSWVRRRRAGPAGGGPADPAAVTASETSVSAG